MKTSKIIAIFIWVIVFIQIIPNAFIDPSPFPPDTSFNEGMKLIRVLFPVIFFSVAGLVIQRPPFNILAIRQGVDRKFGDGAYTNFIINLKPMLLISFAAIGTSLALPYASYRAGPPYRFFASEFMAEGIVQALHVGPTVDILAFFVGAIFFFYIPVSIFVFGYQYRPDAKEGETELKNQTRRIGGAMARGFCWLAGAGITMIVLFLIDSLLHLFQP